MALFQFILGLFRYNGCSEFIIMRRYLEPIEQLVLGNMKYFLHQHIFIFY